MRDRRRRRALNTFSFNPLGTVTFKQISRVGKEEECACGRGFHPHAAAGASWSFHLERSMEMQVGERREGGGDREERDTGIERGGE